MKKITLKTVIIEYVLFSIVLHLLSGTLINITMDNDIRIVYLGYVLPILITKIIIEVVIGKNCIVEEEIINVKRKIKKYNIITFLFLTISIGANNIFLFPSYIINGSRFNVEK